MLEEPSSTISIVEALKNGLTANSIMGTLVPYMPVIITLILVALSLYFLRRITKGAKKANVKF